MSRTAIAITVVCCAAVLGVGLLVRRASQREVQRYEAFMASCQQHRPEYECTYLWRSSRDRSEAPAIVPVPLPTVR